MTTALAQIGVVGMGVMGTSLARNFARHGYRTAIWNLEPARTREVAATFGTEGTFLPSDTLPDFVNSLETPRKILLMVTAGKAVDAVMENLAPLLSDGDIVIDGGNSFFADTRRREAQWREHGIHFMGVGVSGGEVGALEGPSIMPGGSDHAYAEVGPFLEAIAAKAGDNEPCCAHMGHDGAGHYVKMVHNGIEYADMQLIAEAYDILRHSGRDPKQIAAIFREWNTTNLQSYLVEITSEVLEFTDPRTGQALVDVITDRAEQKGTGQWTAQNALELGIAAPTIAESVFARSLSASTSLREASGSLPGPDGTEFPDTLVDDLRQALWASKVICYAQGLDQIRTAAKNFDWDTDPAEVAKIWRAGCIIRAALLDQIRDEYAAGNLATLLVAPSIEAELGKIQGAWRRVVSTAVLAGIPTPAFTSAVAYYDGVRAKRLPAALVQGLRDYFGAHTYARTDSEGKFHIAWSGDHQEVRMDAPPVVTAPQK